MASNNNAHDEPDGPIDPDTHHGQETLRDHQTGDERVGDAAAGAPAPEKPSPHGFAAVKAKLGLNRAVLIPMFKGSLPPIIGIAMCQSKPVANYFLTLGYLIPIISVLGLAVLPRGKFLQNLVLNLLAICSGSALALLALWSSIKARENTTAPGESAIDPLTGTVQYNSSQSAVLAVWLFANIWFVNVLRAKFPAFAVPVILFSILVNVACTFGTRMPTVVYAEKFVQELLTAMLTGLALATGVNLLVIPVSSRMVLTKEFAGAIGLLRKSMALQRKYLVGLEELDMFAVVTHQATLDARAAEKKMKKKSKRARRPGSQGPDRQQQPSMTKEAMIAKELKTAIAQVREMTGKIQADITFAKRDVAWGKLDAKDLGEIAKLLRNATIPVVGISSIMDIFQRVAERRGWNVGADEAPDVVAQKDREKRVWNEVMRRMHTPFEILSEAVDQGLEHAALRLEILPRPKADKKSSSKDADVEAKGDSVKPGDDRFSEVVRQKLAQFDATKGEALRAWVKERALVRGEDGLSSEEARERDQAQLYCLLYMERLMHASGEAMHDLVVFADRKVQDGTMARKRLIFPTQRRLRKWIVSVFREEDSSAEESPDVLESGMNIVYVGDGYNRKKDPEHLPPTNAWQRAGNGLRKVSDFFGSEECAFGFRVAAATMTIGIVAFLERTQSFFVAQRLVWAMIMIAIGMTMTSGQSIFGFFCRVGGTVIAMVCSLIIWYIVNERTAGVIVFLWLSLFCDYYFLIKFPRFTPAVMITMVTQCLIIGYELQVRNIGAEIAASSGQPFFPTYKLAPFRLATVAGGCFVAFIWTIFPSPLTDRTWLRRDLSAALYLLANYYGVITSTVKSQIDGTAGDPDAPHTPAHELQKIRRKIFGKMMLLLPSVAAHAAWQRWEPTVGGRFPREAYEDIIARTTRIMSYLTFMSYTMTRSPGSAHPDAEVRERDEAAPPPVSQPPPPPLLPSQKPGSSSPSPSTSTPSSSAPDPQPDPSPSISSDRAWLDALAAVLRDIAPSHHNIVSTLMLLSNSLFSGHSMPPYLPLPRPYEMTRALLRLDRRRDAASTSEEDEKAEVSSDEDGDEDEDEDEDEADLSPLMVIDSRTGHEADPPQRGGQTLRRRRRGGGDPGPGLGLGLGPGKRHVLDAENVSRPGYAEFAVLEICSTLVCDDLEGLIGRVGGLVGVVDFSYRVGGSEVSLGSSSGSDGGGGDERVRNRGRGKGKVD